MDLFCKRCGEPWDNDSLHEEAALSGRTYDQVAADFRARGCQALTEFGPLRCEPLDSETQATIGLVYELSGGDMDAAALNLAELREMGLL